MRQGQLIAVVDDDASIRDTTSDLLESAGYSAVAFSSPGDMLASGESSAVESWELINQSNSGFMCMLRDADAADQFAQCILVAVLEFLWFEGAFLLLDDLAGDRQAQPGAAGPRAHARAARPRADAGAARPGACP